MAFMCIYAVRECTGCGGCAPSPREPRCDGCGRPLDGADSMEIGGRLYCDDCIHARYGEEEPIY